MRLLHTSDWHLGRMLYSKKERNDEHSRFLEWLLDVVRSNAVDMMVIAGDVFDTAAPSNAVQKMYYDFLLAALACGCRNVTVVGGNHDSPSLLDAPKELLGSLNVKVVGRATDNPDDEVFVATGAHGEPVAVICAVPFLRERDISRFTEGESAADRSKRIAENIRRHYRLVADCALQKRAETGCDIPIIATGHLSVAGGITVPDDGVRDTYIGSIECVGSDIFPDAFDYVALGHFHIASTIGGNEHIRYCGSPIPLGFIEAEHLKRVVIVDFEQDVTREIPIPCFQKLTSVKGNKAFIANRLSELKNSGESHWVEVIYDGSELFADFQTWVEEQVSESNVEVLKIQNKQYMDKVLTQADVQRDLSELSVGDVFDRLLSDKDFPEEQKAELRGLYEEMVSQIEKNDNE